MSFRSGAGPRVTTREHLEGPVASRPHSAQPRHSGFRSPGAGSRSSCPGLPEQVARNHGAAREYGFQSINYDLIYGLPFQTRAEYSQQTIEIVRQQRPDRIAFYAYAHVPWIKPSQRRFTEADLPQSGTRSAPFMKNESRQMLESVGYREIGMDHFCAGDGLAFGKRLLMGVFIEASWDTPLRQVSPLIGFQVSAIAESWGAFAAGEKSFARPIRLVWKKASYRHRRPSS